MENPDEASSYGKVDGIARWFAMSVASAFFASLERFSCVNLNTSDTDDEDEQGPKDRPLGLDSSQSMNSTASTSFAPKQDVNVNVNGAPPAVENLPV